MSHDSRENVGVKAKISIGGAGRGRRGQGGKERLEREKGYIESRVK